VLRAYRRHRKHCTHRPEGQGYRRCKCPVWVDGTLAGVEVRRSLGTRDWEKAQDLVRKLETTLDLAAVWDRAQELVAERAQDLGCELSAPGDLAASGARGPITISQACDEFVGDAEARKLHARTVYKYRLLFRQLREFAEAGHLRFVKQLGTAEVRRFRATWKDGNLAALKKLERLRSFFRFAVENRWVTESPAAKLSNPKVTMRPTLPFSDGEMLSILDAAERRIPAGRSAAADNARRLRVLVLLLRYSGLRIGDAVGCARDRLADGRLRLYTQKTGTHVHCPLPEFLVEALSSLPPASERFWFWTGNGKLQTAVADWQGRLHTLFEDAGITGGHAHRFRDTFAVALLLNGTPLERVSVLLGHSSVKVTERHYSPWVRERQEQAEADVRRTWAQDSVALAAANGTQQVQLFPGARVVRIK